MLLLRCTTKIVPFMLMMTLFSACGDGDNPSAPRLLSWGTAELIETDNVGDAEFPQVVVDGNGNALAAWQQFDGIRTNILANQYTAATGRWGTAELIETDNAGHAYAPQLAVDSSGNALAVWFQSDGIRTNIWANRYSVTTGNWGVAAQIEINNAGNAYLPNVTFDGSGNALAVWSQYDGVFRSIWANRYESTTASWGAAELVETDNAGDATYPKIAFDDNGNALVVWQMFDGIRHSVWANRYSETTASWGTSELIETDNIGDANFPQLAFDGSGNALVVWVQLDGTRFNVWANRYMAVTGKWGTAEMIEIDNAGDAWQPKLTVDASGNALAVWDQYDGPFRSIWANRYSATNASWGTAELIETGNVGHAYNTQVASDSSGNALAVWEQSDGSVLNIWANLYTATTSSWGQAELIEINNSGDAGYPQLAFDSSGNGLVVWHQSDGTRSNIWFNSYRYR